MDTNRKAPRPEIRISARLLTRILAAVLAAAIVIGLCISISCCRNIQQRYTTARNRTGEAVYQNLYMLLRKNDETTLAGADIEDAILPEMREYFFAARALNEAIGDAYGARYSVLTSDQVGAIEKAFSDYEAAFKGGKSITEAQNTMIAALQPVEKILLDRYDSNGLLLPAP